jgi:hypothetical protein
MVLSAIASAIGVQCLSCILKICDLRIMRKDFITDFSPVDKDVNFELRFWIAEIYNDNRPIVFWETNQQGSNCEGSGLK